MIKRLLAWLRWIVPLAAAWFIAHVIWGQWQRVRDFDWRLDPLYLGLALAAGSSWCFARAYVWRRLVQQFGATVPFRESARIFAVSELSRYAPGKVWQHAARVYLAARLGVPAAATLTSALMDVALMALAATPWALWRLGEMWPALGRAQGALLLAFPLASLLALQPAVWNRLGGYLLPRLKMEHTPIRLGGREIALLWAVCLLLWAVFGAAFALFTRSLTPVAMADTLPLASSYAMAWLAGMAAPFAPGGLVVREGILGLLLGNILPRPVALLVAVLSRLWMLSLELFWAAALALYCRAAADRR